MIKKTTQKRTIEAIVTKSCSRKPKSNDKKLARVLATGKGKLLCIIACSTLSACSGNFEMFRPEHFVQSGSAPAINAQAEREHGTINIAKTPSGKKPAHYELQEKRVSVLEKFLLHMKPKPTK